ncbi:divergent PAP2 family protein [Candidatus Woesearchaeota archaeon]|nr:divergent PAP2 family protein [Candidatus Woesearchaeota archaeon]
MVFLKALLMNPIFLAGLIAMLTSQFCKFLVVSYKKRKVCAFAVFDLAGMPSSHTATAIAALSIVYFEQGVSTIFMVALGMVIFLLDSLFNVDRNIGKHAAIINAFLGVFPGKLVYKPLRTEWGHTIGEILIGGIIGYAIAYAVWYF